MVEKPKKPFVHCLSHSMPHTNCTNTKSMLSDNSINPLKDIATRDNMSRFKIGNKLKIIIIVETRRLRRSPRPLKPSLTKPQPSLHPPLSYTPRTPSQQATPH